MYRTLQNPNRTKRIFTQLQNVPGYSRPQSDRNKKEVRRGDNCSVVELLGSPCPTFDEAGFSAFASTLQGLQEELYRSQKAIDVQRWIETQSHANQTQALSGCGKERSVAPRLESSESPSKCPLIQLDTPVETSNEKDSNAEDSGLVIGPDEPNADSQQLPVTPSMEPTKSSKSSLTKIFDTPVENNKELDRDTKDPCLDMMLANDLNAVHIHLPVQPGIESTRSPTLPIIQHTTPVEQFKGLKNATKDSAPTFSITYGLEPTVTQLLAISSLGAVQTPRESNQLSPMTELNVRENESGITPTANQKTAGFMAFEPSTFINKSVQSESNLFSNSLNSTIIFTLLDDGTLVPVATSPSAPGSTAEEGNTQHFRRSVFPTDINNVKRKRQNQAPIEPQARKRQSYPSNPKVNAAKAARHAGKELSKTGKVFPKKELGPPCKEDCKLKCHERVTNEDRQLVFDKFYESHDQRKKWDFISRLLYLKRPDRPSAETISGKNRSTSIEYHVRVKGDIVRVCKTLFLSTLQISEQVIKTVVKKLGQSCWTSPDKRGLNKPGSRIPVETTQSVKDHINIFPRAASHFCRSNSTCEYLEEGVGSVKNMFRLYETWAQENGIAKPATYRQYLDVFNNTPGLDIRFFKPKKVQCCFAYGQKTKIRS